MRKIKIRLENDIYNKFIDICNKSHNDPADRIEEMMRYVCNGWEINPERDNIIKDLKERLRREHNECERYTERFNHALDRVGELTEVNDQLIEYKAKYYSLIKSLKI
jgi:hemerythrin-like domain-containing protein